MSEPTSTADGDQTVTITDDPESGRQIVVDAFPEDQRRFVEVDGVEIAIVNAGGEYYAFRNFCPHMGAPLGRGPVTADGEGSFDGDVVTCPFHSWGFKLESGQSTFGDLQLATFEATVENDTVYVDIPS